MDAADTRTKLITVQQVWAVIRVDTSSVVPIDAEELADQFVVKEVLLDEHIAKAEVTRLNELNRDKGARYFCQSTRLRDLETNVIPQSDMS